MKSTSGLIKHIPIITLICIWMLFSSPFFFQHKIPYPADQLTNNYAPWSDYSNFHGPVKNAALSDVVTQLFPWKYLTIQAYKAGHLPFWNPYTFSGNPLAANYQSAIFSPLTLLFFILPFITAWSLLVLIQPLLAGLGTYFFVISLTKNKWAGVLSGVTYMFCGFITVWMAYGTLSMAASVLPWILLFLEKLDEKRNFGWILLGAISVAVSFLSGHFQTSLYVVGLSVMYALTICPKTVRGWVSVFVLFLGGFLLSVVQILPTLSIFTQTVRSNEVFSDAGIPWWYLITSIVPDFFGNPTKLSDWVGHYGEWASFIGVIPLLFSLQVLPRWKEKRILFFLIATCFALLFSLQTPLLPFLSSLHIPVFSSSYPTRIIVLASFSLSILAGYGFAFFSEEKSKNRVWMWSAASIGSILLISLIGAYLFLPKEKVSIVFRNMVIPQALCIFSLGLLVISRIKPRFKQISLIGVVILSSIQSVLFARQWMPFTPQSQVYPALPVISAIQNNLSGGRAYGTLSNAVYSYYKIPSIEGYDPVYSQRYSNFIRASDHHANFGLTRSEITIDPHSAQADRLLNFLGVSILYQPKSHDFQPWAYPVWEKGDMWKKVYEDSSVRLFKNTQAMSRATLFCTYEVVPEEKNALMRFYSKDFDYKTNILLSSSPKHAYGTYCTQVEGEAKITEETTDHVKIAVSTKQPSLLLVTNTYFSQVKAEVNGKPTDMYPADVAFDAIEVPKGNTTVILSARLF